ncbi:MAG: hypothetical protein ACOYIK_02190, partial [Coriobacteriales bacterium]
PKFNNNTVEAGSTQIVKTGATVDFTITDKYFEDFKRISGWEDKTNLTITQQVNGGTKTETSVRNGDLKLLGGFNYGLTNPLTFTEDGTYKIEASYNVGAGNILGLLFPPTKTSITVVVDGVRPVLTGVEIKDGFNADSDKATLSGVEGTALVGESRVLKVRVQDLLQNGSSDYRDQTGASGISDLGKNDGVARVKVKMTCRDGLSDSGNVTETPVEMELEVDSAGWIEIPLDDEGVYLLDSVDISGSDKAGNDFNVNLGNWLDSLSAQDRAAFPFDSIIVADPSSYPDDSKIIQIDVEDADGVEPSIDEDGYYHRGDVKIQITIDDKWFGAYQGVANRQQGFFKVTATDDTGAAIDQSKFLQLTPADFTRDPKDGKWKATYVLPRAVDSNGTVVDNGTKPIQGDYTLKVSYKGLLSSTFTKDRSFGIDWSGPTFESVNLSDVSPVAWGWVFPDGEESIDIKMSDNLSGVNGDSVSFVATGLDNLDGTYDESTMTYTVVISEDGDRLEFSKTGVKVTDKAGNPGNIDSLLSASSNNFPANTRGVSIDSEAPVISVTYDNNDVRNDRYYNAERNATVEIDETNFDILKANDPDRIITKVSKDGRKVTEIPAKDFKNPSGDNKTWIASTKLEDDGEWVVDASLTDGAGKEATPYHSSFCIDKTAPVISVQFDNNDSENGNYYKAPRTATVQIRDVNFSDQLVGLSSSAADASGASVAAPGYSAWQQGDNNEWTCSIYFGQELHYSMGVTCTDLAGNEAEAFEEPEFIIDMTAPVVSIGNVENGHAYAGSIAPTIEFSDTNFDKVLTDYVLTGSAQGDVYSIESSEQDSSTGMSVAYEDFARVLENDDVYTLDASISDKAGNKSEEKVTFSVNRFGSNYVFVNGTENIAGTYQNSAPTVTVNEINVSGLDTSKSHVEVVHDSQVMSLESGKDYQTTVGTGSQGWSVTTYTLPSKLFETDGYYRVLLTSRDLADNLSQNSMDAKNSTRNGTADLGFAVDTTAPENNLIGVESGQSYLSPELEIGIDSHDNLGIKQTTLKVDGKEVAVWGADMGENDYTTYSLPADNASHSIELESVDLAGNTRASNFDGVFLAKDWGSYVLNTPQMRSAFIAIVIGAIAAVGIAIYLVRRHRRLTEARRNPFGH